MSAAVAVRGTGLVTSVGLSAPAACAALRAGLANPSQTRFIDSAGEWIMAHRVPLAHPWVGITRLAKMAAIAASECLANTPRSEWQALPLMLCVAEPGRPGRAEGLEEGLFDALEQELQTRFSDQSRVIAQGRASDAVALDLARRLIHEEADRGVLIVAADSLLSWGTISHYERVGRLLTAANSNGFIPGEGAGAVLVTAPANEPELLCLGIGLADEPAHIDADAPLRGDCLTKAINAALADAGRDLGAMDFRITDLSGEQYYFKEAALALVRVLRTHKDEFPLWHPAECIGEQGAAAGVAVLTVADAACRKGYASGPRILAHMANDTGQRAALILEYGTKQ